MGGNSRAINSRTQKTVAHAERIDFSHLDRSELRKDLVNSLDLLNDLFYGIYDKFLWPDFDVVKSGFAFTGSTEQFMDTEIDDEEFIRYKPTMGDIDLTLPYSNIRELFSLLRDIEGSSLLNFQYLGQPKTKFYGFQINCVFRYKDQVNIQIDFQGTDYQNDKPTDWAKFSSSSDWNDMKRGFKGVHHKFLIINIVRATSLRNNIMVLTPKSPIDEENYRPAVKYQRETPRMWAFSVAKGLRVKLKPVLDENGEHITLEGQKAYKIQPTAESEYITDIPTIFENIFNSKSTGDDLDKFYSLLGVVDLMEKYLNEQEVLATFEFLYQLNLFGEGAQQLYRDYQERDKEEKWRFVNLLLNRFSYLENLRPKLEELSLTYYQNYGK